MSDDTALGNDKAICPPNHAAAPRSAGNGEKDARMCPHDAASSGEAILPPQIEQRAWRRVAPGPEKRRSQSWSNGQKPGPSATILDSDDISGAIDALSDVHFECYPQKVRDRLQTARNAEEAKVLLLRQALCHHWKPTSAISQQAKKRA